MRGVEKEPGAFESTEIGLLGTEIHVSKGEGAHRAIHVGAAGRSERPARACGKEWEEGAGA